MPLSLVKWGVLGVSGFSVIAAGTFAIIGHKNNLAEDALWNTRAKELAKKIKADSSNWKKLVKVITGVEEESVFKVKENGDFEKPEEAKQKLKAWCLDSKVTNRTYNSDNLENTICKFKKE